MTLSASTFEHLSGELAVESVASLGDLSPYGVAIESANGQVWLAWTESRTLHLKESHTYHLNMMSSPDGQTFGNRQRLPHRSTVRNRSDSGGRMGSTPSLAAHNDVLLLAWPYANDHRKSSQRYPGILWGDEQNVVVAGRGKEHRVALGVSVASWRGGVALAWLQQGLSGGVTVSHGQDGVFGEPRRLVRNGFFRQIEDAPDVCAIGDQLLVSWIDKKKVIRYHLNVVSFDGTRFGPRMDFPGVTVARMCELGGEPVVAWYERTQHLCVGFLRAGALTPALRLGAGNWFTESSVRPDICVHEGGLVLAWTVPGQGTHVARIRRA